jgi:hypothetical protein
MNFRHNRKIRADIGNKTINAPSRPVVFASQCAKRGIIPPITPSAILKLNPMHVKRTSVANSPAIKEGRKLNWMQNKNIIIVNIKNIKHPDPFLIAS